MTDPGIDKAGVQDAAKQKAGEVLDQAQQVGNSIQDRVIEETDVRSTTAGEQMGSVADAMHGASEQLRTQGNDLPAAVTEQVTQRVDQLGRYLRESDGQKILDDAQAFARQQPWVVAALGLAAGLAVARLLKASARNGNSSRPPRALPVASTAHVGSGYDASAEDRAESRYAPSGELPSSLEAGYSTEARP